MNGHKIKDACALGENDLRECTTLKFLAALENRIHSAGKVGRWEGGIFVAEHTSSILQGRYEAELASQGGHQGMETRLQLVASRPTQVTGLSAADTILIVNGGMLAGKHC